MILILILVLVLVLLWSLLMLFGLVLLLLLLKCGSCIRWKYVWTNLTSNWTCCFSWTISCESLEKTLEGRGNVSLSAQLKVKVTWPIP